MAFTITSCIPSTAKEAFIRGEFLASHTYRMGLFRANASLGRNYNSTTNTRQYSQITTATSDEVASGGGYSTGGVTSLATYNSGPENVTPAGTPTGNGAWIDWTTDPSWTTATFTASGCFIYDDSHANKLLLCVIDFGGDKSVTSGTFTVQLPAAAYNTAIIQLG
jgi:hypothetical protein